MTEPLPNPDWLDQLELSPATREYVDALPVQGGPQAVLSRYAARSIEDVHAERVARRRQKELAEQRENFLEMARSEGQDLHDEYTALRNWEIDSAIQDAHAERHRQAEQEARERDLQRRLAAMKERLNAEQKRSKQASARAVRAKMDAAYAAKVALRQDDRIRDAGSYYR